MTIDGFIKESMDEKGAHNERGSGTVLITGLGLVALLLLVSLIWLVQSAAAGQRAATAADMAALAAADAARGLSAGDPCGIAAEVAIRAGVDLVACDVGGDFQDVVEVRTVLKVSALIGAATGTARAGPPAER